MIRTLVSKKLASVEKSLGVSLDYAHHVLRTSLRAFFQLVKIDRLSKYRRALPPEPYHVARIVAIRDTDCGPCVQAAVSMAKRDSVPDDVLRTVLAGTPEALPLELADAYRFSQEVVRATGEEAPYRERIRQRYGEEALVELALAVAVSRVFPVTKRVLGYGMSCSRVRVEV